MLATEVSSDAPVSRPAVTGELTQTGPSSTRSAPAVHKDSSQTDENQKATNDRSRVGAPAATVNSVGSAARHADKKNFAPAESQSETLDTVERIKAMLKSIDVALVEIPALPCE